MGIRQYLSNGPLGFGTAPLGNMFRNIPDEEASATVEAAWQHGTRYFDTAPFYGAGLAEIRLGRTLSRYRRDEYVLSTKVGRIILDEVETGARDFGEKTGLFEHGRPNKVVYDYSADGARRSIEDSLERMGTDRVDFVWIHDLAQDFHGDEWLSQFETARKGAFRALTQMREEGVIKGWGLGVNRIEPVELMLGLAEAKPDGSLLAGRYTLLDHERALERLMPAAAAKGVDIVVGGPYSSGVLAGGRHFEYTDAPPEILARVERIKALVADYQISIKAAALQFVLAHPAVAAVIPGASKPSRIQEDHDALRADIPNDFWSELRRRKLVSPNAPLPIDRVNQRRVAHAFASVPLAVEPDRVWQLIGGFGSLPEWQPSIPTSQLSEGGRLRRLTTADGVAVVEHLEEFDNDARSYTYSIRQAPFPVTGYRSTLRVLADNGNGCLVEWSGSFTPMGVSVEQASALFQKIYEDGLKALSSRFAVR
jgi:D-threo-aldose 1-dehydrogenase